MSNSLVFLSILLGAQTAYAGTNCKGSTLCSGCHGASAHLKGVLDVARGNAKYNETVFTSGEHIACEDEAVGNGACCVFYKGGASGTVFDVYTHLENIFNQGCDNCGSDPAPFTNSDTGEPDEGELTVNFIVDYCDTLSQNAIMCLDAPDSPDSVIIVG